MLNIIFYFQVHQPYRLSKYKILDIGSPTSYFDDNLNRDVINKVSEKCYLPSNEVLYRLIKKFPGKFKIAFSITGAFIEQLKEYRPDVLDSFKKLAHTGQVEFIGETYYHSLSALFDEEEFIQQVEMHTQLMKDEFDYQPVTFRNTELIYNNRISDIVQQIPRFKTILTEGADKVLGWKSPLYAYSTPNRKHLLLMKYYPLSDDIAFRFSNKNWIGYPLTVDRFYEWIERLPLIERENRKMFLNLFMDYETFGEHQWHDTGIFEFMEHLPGRVLQNDYIGFCNPKDVNSIIDYEPPGLEVPETISWADTERDLSAWLSNALQWNASNTFYQLLRQIKQTNQPELIAAARRLSTSDMYYYMCTKYFQDGDVHKYFSPYDNPEDAYIYFLNVLADMEIRIQQEEVIA